MGWARRIVLSAVAAGIVAGLLTAFIHQFTTVPLILHAEQFETHAPISESPHATVAWMPTDGWQRNALSVSAEVLTGIGFALVLVAIWALTNVSVTSRQGCVWGLAAFAAVTVAPSLGLPPELPGAQAAALHDRQLWWIFAVAATASGLATLAFATQAWQRILGIALIVLPQLIGAPQPRIEHQLAPLELVERFRWTVYLTSAVFWLVLGTTAGAIYAWMNSADRNQSELRGSND